MMAHLINGNVIAKQMRAEIANEVQTFIDGTGVQPHLVVILVGDDAASQVYVKHKEKDCLAAGMQSTVLRMPADTCESKLLETIAGLNSNVDVHGILVQLPLPKQIAEQAILDAISPLKDVDAFHPENVGLMVQGRPRFLPCTPAGSLQLIQTVCPDLAGKHAVVVGRSEIVGKPMSSMLIQKGVDATVTLCHSRTRNLAELTLEADILVAAIGKPEFITAGMIKPGAIVIDVGINRVGEKLVGDVAFAGACEVAAAITPVPGGVGPMTRANLLQNALQAARIQTLERHP